MERQRTGQPPEIIRSERDEIQALIKNCQIRCNIGFRPQKILKAIKKNYGGLLKRGHFPAIVKFLFPDCPRKRFHLQDRNKNNSDQFKSAGARTRIRAAAKRPFNVLLWNLLLPKYCFTYSGFCTIRAIAVSSKIGQK